MSSPIIAAPSPGAIGPSSTALFLTPAPVPSTWDGLHWVRLSADDPLSLVTAVRRWKGGYVAVGWDPTGGRSTPVWSSTDGETWQPIRFNTATTFWPGMMIRAVAAVPGGVVAIGRMASDCGNTCPITYSGPVVAWASRDGLSWSPHVIPEEWVAGTTPGTGGPLLAAGPAGLIVGLAGSRRLAASSDGIRWTRGGDRPLSTPLDLTDIAGTASGYIAVGGVGTLESGATAAASWSTDGRRWSSLIGLPAVGKVPVPSAPDAILVARDGVVGIGRLMTSPGSTLWWQSRDGRQWSSLPTYAPLGASDCVGEGCALQPAGGLVADGERIVGVRFGRGADGWTTTDATGWSPLDMFGDLPDPDAEVTALLPSGVLATKGGTSWLGVAVAR